MAEQFLISAQGPEDVTETLRMGKNAIKEGNLEKGLEIYQSVLELDPENKIARKRIRALGRRPTIKPPKLNRRRIAPPEKVSSFLILADSGRSLAALNGIEELLQQYPRDPSLYFLIGNLQREVGRFRDSVESYQKSIELRPRFSNVHLNLGCSFEDLGDLESALASYKKAIELDRRNFLAFYNTALLEKSVGRIDAAIESYQRALRVNPHHAESNNNLGNLFRENNQASRAIKLFERAIEVKPHYAEAYNNLGIALKEVGLNQRADKQFLRAIEKKPRYAEAYYNLSGSTDYCMSPIQIKEMKGALEQPGYSRREKMFMNFALFNALDRSEASPDAIKYLIEANRLCRGGFRYSLKDDEIFFSGIKDSFINEKRENPLPSADRELLFKYPIFVVGLPRSGTSLIEQILASHSQVFGAGELDNLYNLIKDDIESVRSGNKLDLSRQRVSEIRSGYLTGLARLGEDCRFVVDKMPANFLYLGHILKALPEAKVVHCFKNPIASCFSMFKQHFPENGYPYAYKLEELGQYFKFYKDLMQFWEEQFPGQIYQLNYEELVKDQRSNTSALLKYCELNWEEECLNFHKTNRVVSTASSSQVRKPLYSASSAHWKRYRKELEPLRDVLFWDKFPKV